MTLRCLIVDDNAGFLDAAATLLEGQGLSVVGVAASAAEAKRLVEALRPDIVLVDINLGDESGFDVARILADYGRPGRPTIILVSTHDELEFAEQIEASPAAGFVPKTELSAERILDLV